MNSPNCKKPCSNCPFRQDCNKGWLGAERMAEIINYPLFTCHKNNNLQCAGHMLINNEDNVFVRTANAMQMPIALSGQELIFETKEACIEHHR